MFAQKFGSWTAGAVALLLLSGPSILAQSTRSIQRVSVPSSVPKDGRWALVIGNADYTQGRLRNPLHDAADMARALEDLGFTVELLENASRQRMEEAVRDFGSHLEAGDVGLFYFAGHGVQVGGKNYLIPVGEEIAAESEVPYKSVHLDLVLHHMAERGDRLNVVILDACRDNPFRTAAFRSLTSSSVGLAETLAPAGTIIAFATAPGNVAADGTGRNGIFTAHLLDALRREGLTIEEVFKRTRQGVVKTTAGNQVPWTSSSLIGDFIPRPVPPGRSEIKLADLERPQSPAEIEIRPPAGSVDAERPSQTGFSLDSLERQADIYESKRQTWNEHLLEMRGAFRQVEGYEKRDVPIELKVQVWRYFLQQFNEDNPYSEEDDELRRQASRRFGEWQSHANGTAPITPPPPALEPGEEDDAGAPWVDPVTQTCFSPVAPGTFRMGSPRHELGREFNETPHQVNLTRGAWVSETEVTQSEWRRVLGDNPSFFDGCEDCPVERVNWYEAVVYANELSAVSGLERCYELRGCTGNLGDGCGYDEPWCRGDFSCDEVILAPSCSGYRLPTEAEWEYAARAGTKGAFSTGLYLSLDDANFQDSKAGVLRNRSGTVSVKSYTANAWGLYDVHGNVMEWTWDVFGRYPGNPETDPAGPGDGSYRAVRGGGWKDPARLCRSATRRRIDPINRFHDVGFRLVRDAP